MSDAPPPQPIPDVQPQSLLGKAWERWGENIKILTIALLLAVTVRTFIAEPRFIPSESMFPTLNTGDRLVVEKISYYSHLPQRGDVVVFAPPSQLQEQGYQIDQAFIKRVIGLPGDRVAVADGKVSVNNVVLNESYIAESPNYIMHPVIVPRDNLFVMGDNRNNSNDSHIWGFLPKSNVIGRACFRFWPIETFGAIDRNRPSV
jgi:signal peptidase I